RQEQTVAESSPGHRVIPPKGRWRISAELDIRGSGQQERRGRWRGPSLGCWRIGLPASPPGALAVVQEAALELNKKQVLIVAAYGFAIMILYRLGSADAAGVPLSFILKDRLHLSPSRVSIFSFLIDWPF